MLERGKKLSETLSYLREGSAKDASAAVAAAAVAADSPAAPMATAGGLVQPPLKRAGSEAMQPSLQRMRYAAD